MTTRLPHHLSRAILLALLLVGPAVAQKPSAVPPFDRDAVPGEPPPVPGGDDAPGKSPEILGRGPIHQGFAQPADPTPRPSPVVPKQPPAPIQEIPPEHRPAGDNVVWVPGYWAWDDDRADFLWVSGFWRVPPAGRQWVPGSWTKAAGGWRFISGYWGEIAQPSPPFVDAPPESLDRGPGFPPIDDSYSWVPGVWITRDTRWLWQPGYWCAPRPGWVYTPASYCWTPRGCLYVGGFWDRCLQTRGLPFAPVCFPPGLCATPGFSYTPYYTLGVGGLLNSFWCRPGCNYYAFGDYYGGQYSRAGYQPWYAYGPRARDPLFGYYRNVFARTNPGWARGLASTYDGRVRGELPPPPRAFTARQLAGARRDGPGALVQPLASFRDPALPLVRATAADRARGLRAMNSYRAIGEERDRDPGPPVRRSPGTITTRPRELPPPSREMPRLQPRRDLTPPRESLRLPLDAPRLTPPPRYTPPPVVRDTRQPGPRYTAPPRPRYNPPAPPARGGGGMPRSPMMDRGGAFKGRR